MATPENRALMAEHGIENLAQAYTSKIKYDPDTFRDDSRKLKKLLETKHFLSEE